MKSDDADETEDDRTPDPGNPGMTTATRKRNRASSNRAAIPVRRTVLLLLIKGRFAL